MSVATQVAKKYGPPWWLFLVLGLLVGAPLLGRAQVVDDSTKVLYGPKTTRIIYEDEVRRDSVGGTPIDTTLTNWSQARFWAHDSTFQQDLGALGTASRPLLYEPNLQLGARFGRNVFDRYAREGSQIPYYDSRSPYSFFRYVQSTQGEQVFEINYSRSLKKNFSVGVNYERIASNQVLGTALTLPLVEHNSFTLYSRFQSEDGRYHLLANYTSNRNKVAETGGIYPSDQEQKRITRLGGVVDSLFSYSDERVYLTSARNVEDRDQFHLFQTYRLLGRGLTAYHVLDVRRQYNGYNDDALPRNSSSQLLFYPTTGPVLGTYRNITATIDRATFRQVENTFGLLGHSDRVEYRVYGRYRNASLTATSTSITPPGQSGTSVPLQEVGNYSFGQAFLGGTAAFNYRTIYAVQVDGEVKPAVASLEYWLRGRIRTGPLSAEVLTSSYAPTLTQQNFVGNHYEWHNDFANTKTQQATLRLQQRLPLLAEHTIELSGRAALLTSLVYYDQRGLPAQLSENKTLLIGFARHRVRIGNVYFDNQATYTQGGNGAGLRIPALVTNSRVYYQRHVFGHALFAQVGGEVYYQSRFRGYQYSPSTQQFYVQDDFTMQDFAVANVFVAADISSASIFLKVAYVNQGLPASGYFTTPYYTDYPRRLQFGVRWKFFD